MISYPVTLPDPLVSSHVDIYANNVKLSQMEYSIKALKDVGDSDKFTFSINCTLEESKIFVNFFDSLLFHGVAPFTATWSMFGSTIMRNMRFTSNYSMKALGDGNYSISARGEVI